MKGINTKGLCAQIKASSWLHWSIKDGVHLITNKSWMVTFTDLPREVAVTLLTIFADKPEDGRGFTSDSDYSGGVNFQRVIAGAIKGKPTEETRFFFQPNDNRLTRIYKHDSQFVYVNTDILKAVQGYDGKILSNGPYDPVMFVDANYLVLPYKVDDNPEKEILELFLPHDHP